MKSYTMTTYRAIAEGTNKTTHLCNPTHKALDGGLMVLFGSGFFCKRPHTKPFTKLTSLSTLLTRKMNKCTTELSEISWNE